MVRPSDTRQLADFRQNPDAHLERLARTGEIEVLTVNGQPKGVVMSPEVYEELARKAAMADNIGAINRSLEDIQASRVIDARQAMRDIAAEHGLKVDR